jgi:hypothetical protein
MLLKRLFAKIFLFFSLIALFSCNENNSETKSASSKVFEKGTYGYDASFLKKKLSNTIELQDESGNAKLLLSADYQGRVMSSTASGDSSTSFGWINYNLIDTKQKKAQFNPVGGEERFWIGPEGGQFSIYFKEGDSFNIAHWQVPAVIDTVSYSLKESSKSHAVFTKNATLINYSGTQFNIYIERTINLLTKQQIAAALNANVSDDLYSVGFETDNKLTNIGDNDWSRDKGLLSIWLLGMFSPSDKTTVIIPFRGIPGAHNYITTNYFGEIPKERLTIFDSILFFTCDGKYRSKIGLSPLIAKPIAASFDFEKNVLTIIIPQVDKNAQYVNSKWELQKEPYKGDVINSYNDGPLADGTQMGPFYEVESSSHALELKKGQTGEYKQTTIHLQGDYNKLKELAKQMLGVDLDSIKK